jgi:uncharacterized membrane protein YgaE (UPF0421/DUF939 family)
MVACGLESHKLIPISSNTSFAEVDSFIFCFLLSSNEPIIKQNDQSKFEEEIKKILKKALISAHENSKNEENELIKKNEQFLDEFKNSIIQNQENNNAKRLNKIEKVKKYYVSMSGCKSFTFYDKDLD